MAVDDRMRAVDVLDDDRADGWLYAIGDCNGRAPLTHLGKYRIAADVILGRDVQDRASADVVPRVAFTDPQVAAVGLTEEQARGRGIAVRVLTYGTGDVPGRLRLRQPDHRDQQAGRRRRPRRAGRRHLHGPGVQELLHSATAAIVGQVPLTTLRHAVPSFPTLSEVWLHLLEAYGL